MKALFCLIVLFFLSCSNKNNSLLLDGTWRVTQIECNGVPGNTSSTGAAGGISNGNTTHLIVSGNKAVVERVISGCRININIDMTYTSSNVFNLNYPYPVTCSPAACNGICGATPGVAINYTYNFIGIDRVSIITSDATEGTCTGATPAQQNPVRQVFEKL